LSAGKLLPFTIDDLPELKGAGNPILSPDGQRLVYVVSEMLLKDNGYRSSLWIYEEGSSRRLTNALKPATRDISPVWSPSGEMIAFLSNRSGTNQVWLLHLTGGEAIQITKAPKDVSSFAWMPNSKQICYLAKAEEKEEDAPVEPKQRDGSTARHITRLRYKFNGLGYLDTLFSQLYLVDIHSLESTQLTLGAEDAAAPVVSPDGGKVLFLVRRGPETYLERDLWLLDIASGEQRNLTGGTAQIQSFSWKADSRNIIYTGHHKERLPGAYPEIREMDTVTGEHKLLVRDFTGYPSPLPGADVRYDGGNSDPVLSACGKYLLFIGSEGGNSYLYVYNLWEDKLDHFFGEGQQVVTSFSLANGYVACHLSAPDSIGDIWLGCPQENSAMKQITYINQELFADRWFARPEPVSFTHPDGCQLEGWLMKPYGYQEGSQYPLVMEIHGGPNSTYGNTFFHEFQVLAGMGYGVLYTNPRGSLGYGEDFATVIVGDWCGIDARDLQFMAEEAARIPWVDQTKMGVTGGSQGGYFTNWLVSHCDLFAAAVTQRSMSNLYTKYGTADNGWNGDKYGMGGADLWDNEELLMSRSPIRYADKVKTPILFIHSDMDFRCPLEQAEQFYVAIKRLGTPAEMVLFSGENHELSRAGKPANRLTRLDYLTGWFKRYLG